LDEPLHGVETHARSTWVRSCVPADAVADRGGDQNSGPFAALFGYPLGDDGVGGERQVVAVLLRRTYWDDDVLSSFEVALDLFPSEIFHQHAVTLAHEKWLPAGYGFL